MKWILWIVTAVPVITAGAVLHFKLKESVGGKWNILPKCLATWMIFCTALAGVLQRGNAADAGWIAAGGAGTVSGGGCAVGAAVFCGNGGVCAGAFAADWLVCGTETVYPGQPAGVGDSYGFDAADFPKRAVRRQGAAGPVPDDSVSGGIDGYGFPGGGAAFYRRSAVYLDGGGSGAVYRIGYVCGERIF